MFTRTAIAVALCLGTHATLSHAISGNEQVELAGTGRYEDLRLALEQDAAKGPLKTRDLHALCFAYSKTKRYGKLFQCLDKMSANIAGGDLRTRLFGLDDATPALHLMRAEAQLELGNYATAMDDAKKALAWYKEEGGGDDADIELNGLSLLSIAATLGGNRADGEKYAQQLEDVSTFTLRGNGYVSVKAMALAKAHMALGNYQKTLDAIAQDRLFSVHAFLDRLVSGAIISGKNNWAWQELPRAFMMNRALHGVGKTAEAKAGYDQLLAIPQVKDNGEIYWIILFQRGRIAEAEGNAEQAIEFYRKAVDVIEQQRASINTESSKIGFVGDKQKVYEHLVDALYAKQRMAEAFEYIERSKSRALVDMLASKQVSTLQSTGAAASLAKDFDDAESELMAQVPLSAQEGKQGQRAASAQAVAKIRSAAPELSTLIAVSSLPVDELRNTIPAGEALVQYYYQGQKLYASVFTRADIKMVRLDAAGLEDDIKKFRALIDNQDAQAMTLSRKLYDALVRPLDASLRQSQRLLVVPHGALHYLPFSALNDGQKYLFERYALRSLPSASVLKYLRTGQPGQARQMLVLGNPDLGDSKFDLPSAQVEAEKIAGRAPQGKLLLRRQATETALKTGAAGFSMLHIASHGIFNTKRPLDSALLLAKDDANDGKLTVGELYSMRLNADLVTLSACETGLGQVNTGDDVVGLTRGFLYAGASSVVASLWQVDDEATSQLMIRFYAELASKPKAEALRAAQLEVMKSYPHPYFWSAFYLTGSGQ
jgi:CHAT domain-containing protein